MSHVSSEIESQPESWARAAAAGRFSRELPQRGERVAVIGCGTSWFVAQSYAWLREHAGHGVTDAFAASEHSIGLRDYDSILLISRSGETTEITDLLDQIRPGTRVCALTADPNASLARRLGDALVLDWADEKSVVQTRFATSALVALRASLGEDLGPVIDAAKGAITEPLSSARSARQFTFLGRGWAVGIAHEAALKLREAAQVWTESYPAFEYRHGPISIAQPERVVWSFGSTPSGLRDDVVHTGALFVETLSDPLVDLIRAQQLAVAIASDEGLDPDHPRNLSRAVTLTQR
ncbi:SIS domain-containing protein [Agromyces aerolatus]|uniref:SIS domain-containing protein n=1 Tax=Agromyces sp. LY-1074 TaxID=3074080 RepID=UPI00286078A9|nr:MULTISPECIES: SIS domain-containing protein [unclassified Agromyces]MDR5700488.1 SIS domain-containing protein [Agromyces sp. LY-1074]MDR5707009.1 SIS domain-containing protein [Agromyces sp. LY-1358]